MKGKKVLAGEWQEGCFVYTCINGKSEEKLTEKCTELIKEHVANILENKLKKCKFIQVLDVCNADLRKNLVPFIICT